MKKTGAPCKMGNLYEQVLCRRANKQNLKTQPLGLSEELVRPNGTCRVGESWVGVAWCCGGTVAGSGGVQYPDAPLWVGAQRESQGGWVIPIRRRKPQEKKHPIKLSCICFHWKLQKFGQKFLVPWLGEVDLLCKR